MFPISRSSLTLNSFVVSSWDRKRLSCSIFRVFAPTLGAINSNGSNKQIKPWWPYSHCVHFSSSVQVRNLRPHIYRPNQYPTAAFRSTNLAKAKHKNWNNRVAHNSCAHCSASVAFAHFFFASSSYSSCSNINYSICSVAWRWHRTGKDGNYRLCIVVSTVRTHPICVYGIARATHKKHDLMLQLQFTLNFL